MWLWFVRFSISDSSLVRVCGPIITLVTLVVGLRPELGIRIEIDKAILSYIFWNAESERKTRIEKSWSFFGFLIKSEAKKNSMLLRTKIVTIKKKYCNQWDLLRKCMNTSLSIRFFLKQREILTIMCIERALKPCFQI